jgi:Flp pilus assembly protein TadD
MRLTRSIRSGLLLTTLALVACGGAGKPDKPASQLTFGVQMARRGLWNEALFRFQQAARLDPHNPRIFNNLAVASEALGNFDKAQGYYQDALRIDPANAEVKRNYARFIEFYQTYQKPKEEPGKDADSGKSKAGDG